MSKRKLLLADDSITIQKVVNLTFADEGIEVVSVGDGDAAMLKFNESMPDLVLADVNMPGLDGYRMCEMIKQDDETKHIPVILLVGSFEPFDEQEAWRVGADDFLTKPFQSIRQLVTKVSDLLNPSAKTSTEIVAENESESKTNEWQLDDTQEFPAPEIEDENLGDTGMDDEMIQTNHVGEPVDEMQKFISDSYSYQSDKSNDELEHEDSTNNLVAESFQNEADGDFAILEPSSENSSSETEQDEPIIDAHVYDFPEYDNEPDEDKNTESATVEESTTTADWQIVSDDADEREIASESLESEPTEQPQSDYEAETEESKVTDSAIEKHETAEQTKEISDEKVENHEKELPVPMSSTVSFDDFNLLELPPLVEETGIRPLAETKPVKAVTEEIVTEETTPPTENAAETEETSATETSAQEISAQAFPPELIEAIAQKVAERISDKTIREIAWEVVPQMTDLIVKRLAEEQLNKKAKEMSE